MQNKSVQIPYELFFQLLQYFLMDNYDGEEIIRLGLEKKLDRMVMRDLYGKFKTAPTEEERERARKEVCEVAENHRIDPQYEELDEAFEYDDRYIAPLVTYLTYKLRLALLQRNAGKRKRGIWWVLVHVEMQGYYVEIFSAEFENLLTELRDAVIPMLHTEYVQMLNGKRE